MMPYAINQGIRVHYQVAGNPDGPPLVLQHGFSMSLHDWHEAGYVTVLGPDYRLILIDARGHGDSDKLRDPEVNRMVRRVGDVVAVLDDLQLDRAHYFGYSMGGQIGYGLAMHALDRFHSLVLLAQEPRELDPARPIPLVQVLDQGLSAWLAYAERWFGQRMTPALRDRQARNDVVALQALLTVPERRGFADALPRMDVPCLLLAGTDAPEHAGAEAAAARMPRARFVSLPGLDHIESFYRADLVLPYVTAFLAEMGATLQSAGARVSP